MTLQTRLDGNDSIDGMIDASKEYVNKIDDHNSIVRLNQVKRWSMGIRDWIRIYIKPCKKWMSEEVKEEIKEEEIAEEKGALG